MIIVNYGKQVILRGVFEKTYPSNLVAYTNDYVPTASSTFNDFVMITPNVSPYLNFGNATIVAGQAVLTSDPITLKQWGSPTLPFTVYGILWVRSGGGPLVMVERFTTPIVVTSNDQEITRTITLVLP